MAKFNGDWKQWRDRFISGGDEVTLRWLSEQPGAPSYSSIRKRSAPSNEDWDEQRRNYRNNLGTLAAISPDAQAAARQVSKIIDSAEMMTRHSKAAKLIGSIAIKAFQSYDPASLKPSEATAMMKLAVEVERLTEGLATERREIDVSKLSDEELEMLIDG